ncbi:MAG: hypoxanthine phosphoribosyltransferase [Dehalococcoidia bacterium]|nr:hypoxanthine phosphoribosyltransferase [Dehalococcoidia bacterium]
MPPRLKKLLTSAEIETTVQRLASEITRDYRRKNPLLIGILKGSFVLMADLVRKLDIPLEVDFVRLSSYGSGTESCGRVKVLSKLNEAVQGRHIILVEDIVDTGLTLAFFLRFIKRKKPASVSICALADKPSRRKTHIKIDYRGFKVPDKFIVGYGIDYNEKYRNLPDICYIE